MIEELLIPLIDEGVLAILVFYLMFKFEKSIKENTKAIRSLHYYLKNGKDKRNI